LPTNSDNGAAHPNPNDVLSCLQGDFNWYNGNLHFWGTVQSFNALYRTLDETQIGLLSWGIVQSIRSQSPPGRFLEKCFSTNLWADVGDAGAQEITTRALQEGAAPTPSVEPVSVSRGDNHPAVAVGGGSRSGNDDDEGRADGGPRPTRVQPTPLFKSLVTEEVHELKAYARVIDSDNNRDNDEGGDSRKWQLSSKYKGTRGRYSGSGVSSQPGQQHYKSSAADRQASFQSAAATAAIEKEQQQTQITSRALQKGAAPMPWDEPASGPWDDTDSEGDSVFDRPNEICNDDGSESREWGTTRDGELPADVARRIEETDSAAWREKFTKVRLSVQQDQQGHQSRNADHQASYPIDASADPGFRKGAGGKVKRFIRFLTRVGPRAGRDRRSAAPSPPPPSGDGEGGGEDELSIVRRIEEERLSAPTASLSQNEDSDATILAKIMARTLGLSGAGAPALSEPRREPSRGSNMAPSPRSEEDEGSRAAVGRGVEDGIAGSGANLG
jgi:hypothetical protein